LSDLPGFDGASRQWQRINNPSVCLKHGHSNIDRGAQVNAKTGHESQAMTPTLLSYLLSKITSTISEMTCGYHFLL
jgi:hypothetical protein